MNKIAGVLKSPLLIITCLLSSASSYATEWIVSPTGNDHSGNGSLAQPFRTITHVLDPAANIVRPHDIVSLRGSEGNNVYNEVDVRLRMPLTIRSYPGEWAHIACPLTVQDSVCIQIDPEASGSHLSQLEISGGFYYGIFLQTNWDSRDAKQALGASDVTIEDVKIHDTGRDAIKITPKCNNISIRRSEIWNSGAGYPSNTSLDDKNAEGIDNVNGSGMLVEDSYIHDIATTGVYFKGGAADVTVQRNRIENVGMAGILVGFDTSPDFFDTTLNPNYYESIRGIVRNNIVRNANYAGIGLYAAQNAVVANNTIINTANLGHAGLYFGVTLQDYEPQARRPANVNPIIRNNLVIQNGGDCVRVRWANELEGLSGLDGSSGTDYNWFYNTKGDCNFADNRPNSPLSEGGSFAGWQAFSKADSHSRVAAISVLDDGRLPANSPAIDQGQTLVQVRDDIEQQPHIAAYDIGADEVFAQPNAQYIVQTGRLSLAAVSAGDVLYKVELQNVGNYRFQIADATVLPANTTAAAYYDSVTQLVRIPRLYALGSYFDIVLRNNSKWIFQPVTVGRSN
ncbi:MAG: right-handed parallel beta-helix repeat-containing protein [Methylococcaceae bacterium]